MTTNEAARERNARQVGRSRALHRTLAALIEALRDIDHAEVAFRVAIAEGALRDLDRYAALPESEASHDER